MADGCHVLIATLTRHLGSNGVIIQVEPLAAAARQAARHADLYQLSTSWCGGLPHRVRGAHWAIDGRDLSLSIQ